MRPHTVAMIYCIVLRTSFNNKKSTLQGHASRILSRCALKGNSPRYPVKTPLCGLQQTTDYYYYYAQRINQSQSLEYLDLEFCEMGVSPE